MRNGTVHEQQVFDFAQATMSAREIEKWRADHAQLAQELDTIKQEIAEHESQCGLEDAREAVKEAKKAAMLGDMVREAKDAVKVARKAAKDTGQILYGALKAKKQQARDIKFQIAVETQRLTTALANAAK